MKSNLSGRLVALMCLLTLSFFAIKVNAQTYCTPTYFQGCATGVEINDFSLNGEGGSSISDLGTGCSSAGTLPVTCYRDMHASMSVSLNPATSYTVVSTDATTDILPTGLQIFIDFNDDGTFDPTTESVGGGTYSTLGMSTSFVITIPSGAATGSHRMRAVASGDLTYPSIIPCPTYSFGGSGTSLTGEVHDYTAIIGSGSTSSCGVPTGLVATGVTSTGATLNWSEPGGSVGSEYVVSTTSGTPTGSGAQTTALTYSATGLTPSTVYYAYVRDSCGPGNFSAWVSTTFTTTATTTTTCNPVVLNTPGSITTTSAVISWTAITGSTGYVYVVDNSVTPPGTLGGTFTTLTSATITGLASGTTYYAHVYDSCAVGSESTWSTISFTTLTTSGCNAVTSLTATGITSSAATINWTMASGVSWAEYVIDMNPSNPTISGTPNNASTYNATGLTAATTYYAHVLDSCGVGSLSAWVTIPIVTLSTTGLNNVAPADFSVNVFPNPVKDELTVKIGGATNEGKISLMDISGKLMKTIATDASGNTLNISMSGMPAGIYLIRYVDAGHTQTIKITKE